MAAMLDLLQSASGFTSENSLSGVPTPPYTPARPFRPGKRTRLDRGDSPASVSGSVHPHETESPAKKPAKKRLALDNIKVEDLTEDVGYMGDVDGILPYETESADESSEDDADEHDTATDISGDEAVSLARKLSQMDCTDDREIFLQERKRRRRRERQSVNHTKRTHSLANESIAEPTDVEALGDHDYEAGQRRLRRRTRGPDELEYLDKEESSYSPEAGQHSSAPASIACNVDTPSVEVEVMDIDDAG